MGRAGLGRAGGTKEELGFWVRGGNSSWSEMSHLVSFLDTVHLPQPNMLRQADMTLNLVCVQHLSNTPLQTSSHLPGTAPCCHHQ